MKWQLYELLTRRGSKIVKPRTKSVTLQTDVKAGVLYAFVGNTVKGMMIPLQIRFTLDGVMIKGFCQFGQCEYYQEWWLTTNGPCEISVQNRDERK